MEVVEGQIGQAAANASANQGQGQGFEHEGDDNRAAAAAERAESRAGGHEEGDEHAQGVDQLCQHYGVFGEIVRFARRLDVEAGRAGQVIGEGLEGAR